MKHSPRSASAVASRAPVASSIVKQGLSVVVHGDDFSSLGTEKALIWLQSELENVFELKLKGLLGEADHLDKEVRVLNRVVRLDAAGVRYEADPRHAEMLIQSGGLELGKSRKTPGSKDEHVNYEAVLEDLAAQEVHERQLDGEATHPVGLPGQRKKQMQSTSAAKSQTTTEPQSPAAEVPVRSITMLLKSCLRGSCSTTRLRKKG